MQCKGRDKKTPDEDNVHRVGVGGSFGGSLALFRSSVRVFMLFGWKFGVLVGVLVGAFFMSFFAAAQEPAHFHAYNRLFGVVGFKPRPPITSAGKTLRPWH